MARFRQSMLGRDIEFQVDTDWIDVTSQYESPNPNWTTVDPAGHAHHYDRGYPTLELVIDESHWCDGHEGPWNHDPHEAIDACHYECLICRTVIEPSMYPPGYPQCIPGQKHYRLSGTRQDGWWIEAALELEDVELIEAAWPFPGARSAVLALVLDRQPLERTYARKRTFDADT